mgnify:CR=1 FL=1
MTVGERLKQLREQLGMSQVDFATKINVSKQTLYKYENNIITNIPSDKIESAARICNVSPAYIMGWGNDLSPITSDTSSELTARDEKDIAKILEHTKELLLSQEGLMFDGDPASPEAINSILDAMQIGMEMAKKKNKEKYTPKKYKKD